MMKSAPLIVSVVVSLGIALVADVLAGEPTDQVRAQVEKVYRTYAAAPPAERHTVVRPVVHQMFDWNEMAKRALGRHWQDRTPAEQAEFVKLFSAVFEQAYVSQIELADADRFQYVGDDVDGSRAIVRTRLTTKRGNEIPVDYMTQRQDDARWKVYDLTTGGISLVSSYRTQFNAVITRSSYQGLVEKLRAAASREQ